MTSLDYASVEKYWSQAKPWVLGPYMMDGFGFPPSAGQFRFLAETKIVQSLIQGVSRAGSVLDLGAGIGCWSEYFARDFDSVVGVEASEPLFEALKLRCASYSNVKTVHGNVMSFEPEGRYEVVFLGGLLMYLNDQDATDLLRKVEPLLQPGGIILCRETTVRKGVVTRQGEYQATYRSTELYTRMFEECGLSLVRCEMNVPYVLMQMGCELIKRWKKVVPEPLQVLPIVGHIVYWGLRLGNPWVTWFSAKWGSTFPELRNHFFVLQADTLRSSDDPGGLVGR